MLALFLTILLVTQQSSATKQVDIHWVYVNDNLVWESPPKELKKTYVEASASLVVFYPTGDFALVTCTLFRDRRTGRLSICHGCGFSVSKGTWARHADHSVTIKSRVVYRNLPIIGEPVPGPEVEERWNFGGQSNNRVATVVQSPAGKYVPLSNLADLDFLSNIIAFYNAEKK